MTSTSTVTTTTKVLTGSDSTLAGLGDASLVSVVLCLLVIALSVLVILGVVVVVVFLVRRHHDNSQTTSASSLAPKLAKTDSQRSSM